jgi:hypothetical protein
MRYQATLGAIATILGMAVMAPMAAAVPITYQLSDVTEQFDGIGLVTLTGDFTFDASVPTVDAVSITATGPTSGVLFASPETFDTPHVPTSGFNAPPAIVVNASATGDLLNLEFANPLVNAPDPVTFMLFTSDSNVYTATGEAIPINTPEPASIALLASALGAFSLRRASERFGRGGKQTREHRLPQPVS